MNEQTTTLFGEPMEVWLELRDKAEGLNVLYLLRENASMRAKVSYFDEMVKRAAAFKEVTKV